MDGHVFTSSQLLKPSTPSFESISLKNTFSLKKKNFNNHINRSMEQQKEQMNSHKHEQYIKKKFFCSNIVFITLCPSEL